MSGLNALLLSALLMMATACAADGGKPSANTRLISSFDVKDFGAEILKVGDLNRDGAPDLLFAQSDPCTRDMTCLTATTVNGEVIWHSGKPSADNGVIFSDLPVQVYDWDHDGANEVMWVEQATYADALVWDYAANKHVTIHTTKQGELKGRKGIAQERAARYEGNAVMHILDGLTGKEKTRFNLPPPADDSFAYADLTGRGRREDMVVKDRYWNTWGIAHDGRELWHWEGNCGHYPAVADVDGDGKDEVYVGLALLDHDGKPLFSHNGDHQDAVCVAQLADKSWRLFEVSDAARCMDITGKEIWSHKLNHPQHIVTGRFRTDSEVQAMVIDRGLSKPGGGAEPATLYLFDLAGREVWKKKLGEGSWLAGIVRINWFGPGSPEAILVYNGGPSSPAAVYDGQGDLVDTLTPVFKPGPWDPARQSFYCTHADLWGDSREEVIFFGSRGLCIYANTRALDVPTWYNQTLYPGM
jgi:hypothetical protein